MIDVPDHLVLKGLADAVNDGREEIADYDGDEVEYARDMIAAVIPAIRQQLLDELLSDVETGNPGAYEAAIEARVRAKVATEIEADPGPNAPSGSWWDSRERAHAIRIARGAQS